MITLCRWICCIFATGIAFTGYSTSAVAVNNITQFALARLPLSTSTNSDTTLFEATYLILDSLLFEGNKTTKSHIILRELGFEVGDTLLSTDFEKILANSRNQVYNTGLFHDVSIKIAAQHQNHIALIVAVKERWYIIPAPIFELTDRNFNVWWKDFNHDFRRTEYGLHFYHLNFRGRRERFRTTVQFGFTKKIEFSYKIPFIDHTQKLGINPYFSYVVNTEIPIKNVDNQQVFYRHTDYVRHRFRGGLSVSYRPKVRNTHSWGVAYNDTRIHDTIAQLSPRYFLEGRTRQRSFSLDYVYTSDHRDISVYPLTGSYFQFLTSYNGGLGVFQDVSIWRIGMSYSRYVPLSNNLYWAGSIKGRFSTPAHQPFYNSTGLGFGDDYVRGYERDVIDGQSYLLLRQMLRYRLLHLKWDVPFIKSTKFKDIPLSILPKVYGEAAYSQDDFFKDTNPLANQWLYSGGVGIDIFTFYDMVIGLEYTVNKQGRGNFFFSVGLNYD